MVRRRGPLAQEHAFTLIELLVVILIVGVLIAVAAPSFLGQQTKAQDSSAKQKLALGYKAAKADSIDNPAGQGVFRTGAGLVGALQTAEPGLAPALGGADDATEGGPLLVGATSRAQQLVLHTRSGSGKLLTATAAANGPVSVSGYAGAVMDDNPVNYYRLSQSTRATDIGTANNSASGFYGSASASSSVAGATGDGDTARTFGPAGAGHVDPGVKRDFTGPFSVEAWVKLDAVTTGGASRYIAGNNYFQYGWFMFVDSNGVNAFGFGTAASYNFVVTPTPLPAGEWVHVVGSYRADGVMTMYQNGRPVSQNIFPATAAPRPTTTATFKIGTWGAANEQHSMVGGIDDVALYDYGLTDAQVAEHYRAATGR